MKVLLLSPWFPWPPHDGARIRIYETVRYLSRHHQVTLLANVAHADEVAQASVLKDLCERVETTVLSYKTWKVVQRLLRGIVYASPFVQSAYYDAKLAARLWALSTQERYDIVQIELSYAARYARAINPRCGAKHVLSMHNVESIRYERELRLALRHDRRLATLWDHLFFRRWEEHAVRQFDGVVTVSDLEQRWVRCHAPRTASAMVANGVDTSYYCASPSAHSETPPVLVFTGAMHYPPNIDAVLWFSEQIFPLLRQRIPRLTFMIVGRNPAPSVRALGHCPSVVVTGEVDDVRPYIAKALALVVPLRAGGGTRLKILQAMAMQCPVISTSLGAEGLDTTPGENILLAEDAEQFGQHIQALYDEPEVAQRIGQAGRLLVTEKYDWRTCFGGLEDLYSRLVRSKTA